jgi:hypothetical protein
VYSVINHPDLNGNPSARVLLTTYFNPNGLRNDHTYSVWYNATTDRWNIFPEDLSNLPLDTAFFMGVPDGSNTAVATHVADAGNIAGNYTIIDHPLLNGDPDAVFVYTHNWGVSGGSGNVVNDHVTGVWYTGSNWSIYNEDLSAMPEDAEFELMIFDPTLGVENTSIEGLSYGPNPVNDIVNIQAKEPITSVTIYNVLGAEVSNFKGNGNALGINLSNYSSGVYLAMIVAGKATQTVKIIKQ